MLMNVHVGCFLLSPTGNELHIEVHTDTEYDKKEDASHFGLKCQVMGFEWSASCARSLAILEKELVTLSGMCCGKLLKECSLPWHSGLGWTGREMGRHTSTQVHTLTHKHTHTHPHPHRYTHTDTRTQTHTQTHTHTDTHTYTDTHKHTYRHTHSV